MRTTSSIDTTFVSFPLDDGSFENLHTRLVSRKGYILDNSPFYAYDVSYGDTVAAEHKSGRLLFRSVEERGGHSTYRVKLADRRNHDEFLTSFDNMKALGCTFEGSGAVNRKLYAIDVPPSADVGKIYELLEEGEERGEWEFEEAHFFKGYGS